MNNYNITQPHDRFISKMFAQLEIAEDILFQNIPVISNHVCPGSLENTGEKFVTAELERYYSDILLKAQLRSGSDVYVYLLLEHKSYHEPEAAYDLLQYMMRIWEKVKEKGKRLPLVFSIVIYHGKRRWMTDTNFASLVDIPAGLNDYVPHFSYYLFDLSRYDDEEVKGAIRSRAVLLLLKHIFDENFGEPFIRVCELISKLEDEKSALEFMKSVLEYIGNATDKITQEEVKEGVLKALPLTGEILMPTLFEQLKEEGRVEGHKQGLEQGVQESIDLVLLIMELKYGKEGLVLAPKIQSITSLEKLKEIKKSLRTDISLQEMTTFLESI